MKRIVLAAFLAASFTSLAQSLTHANEPAIGESQVMYLCDSMAVAYENATGSGAVWDFSLLKKYNGEIRTMTIEDATTSSHAAYFPTSTKMMNVENTLSVFYNSSASSRVSQGFVVNDSDFGELIAAFDTDEEKLVEYPFSYGSYFADTYGGKLYFEFNAVAQEPVTNGSCHTKIDGQGTLMLPDGSTINNAIRYKMIDSSWTTVPSFGNLEIIRTQYEYYDISNSNLPVMTFSRLLIHQPGVGLPLADNSIVLSSVEPSDSVALGLLSNDLISFETYPNPTSGMISLKGEFDEDAIAAVYDQSGRLLISQKAVNGASIDLSTVNSGMYLLNVTSNGASGTKTIVKQ